MSDLSPDSLPFASLPRRRSTSNEQDDTASSGLPQRSPATPQPRAAGDLPQRSPATAQPGTAGDLPRRSPGTPQRGAAGDLPRRSPGARPRRAGRHRSLHRISVAADAPALVLAVAGARPATADIADRIAESAADSCPGADIRIGYLSGTADTLGLVLAVAKSGRLHDGHPGDGGVASGQQSGQFGKTYPDTGYRGGGHARRAIRELFQRDQPRPGNEPRAVVVPLLAGPHPALDPVIAAAVRSVQPAVMLAAALGPHPLLAGALHDRLSEAGLARASRARGLNIAAGATGIIVLADRGPEAISEAAVTAVLLAARLAVPAAPASLGDPASIDAAVQRLREAGASRLAIAPCVIGPEIDQAELAALAQALGAPCSAPLGDHPAIAQLVAVRYGEALTRISVASR